MIELNFKITTDRRRVRIQGTRKSRAATEDERAVLRILTKAALEAALAVARPETGK